MIFQFNLKPLSAEAIYPNLWFIHGCHSHIVPKFLGDLSQ